MVTGVDGKHPMKPRVEIRRKDDRNNAAIGEFGRRMTQYQPWPVVLVDAQLTPYFYNKAAKDWAERIKWLRLTEQKLEVLDPALGRKLRHALFRWPTAKELTLHLSDGERALNLTRLDVATLRAPTYIITPGAKDGKAARLEYLQTSYGLTPSEADVASLIYDGLTPKEVAEERKTTIYGVRQHLKPTYKKLKVRSQCEMVKKISEWEVTVGLFSHIGERQ